MPSASASVLVDPKIGELGDFDSSRAILTTASGRRCVISNSHQASYGYDQCIEVHGLEGAVSAENQRPVSIEVAINKDLSHSAYLYACDEMYHQKMGSNMLETKGDQLDNLDTAHKREALALLSNRFEWDAAMPVGELELINNGETVEGTLILVSEWKAKLPAYLSRRSIGGHMEFDPALSFSDNRLTSAWKPTQKPQWDVA